MAVGDGVTLAVVDLGDIVSPLDWGEGFEFTEEQEVGVLGDGCDAGGGASVNFAHSGFFARKRRLKFPHCLASLVPTSCAIAMFELTPTFLTASLNRAISCSDHRRAALFVVDPVRARHAETAA